MDRSTPSPQLGFCSSDAEPERVVVWAFRHWICGHVETRSAHWSMVWRQLNELCGSADGARAAIALEGIVRAICRHADRPILYHQPPCPCLGDDERQLIELMAACQQHQWLNAARWARGFVGNDGAGDLIQSAARLAGLLAEHGQLLPGNFSSRGDVSIAETALAKPVGHLH